MRISMCIAFVLIGQLVLAQSPTQDFKAQATQFLQDYENSLNVMSSAEATAEEKKAAKKVLRPWVNSTALRVYYDLDTTGADSTIKLFKYLEACESLFPAGVKVRLNFKGLEYEDLHIDEKRNAYRVKASIRKKIEWGIVRLDSMQGYRLDSSMVDSVLVIDSVLTVTAKQDTVWNKKFVDLTFYFVSKMEYQALKDLQIEAIQKKGRAPVYSQKLTELTKWWVDLPSKWQEKIRSTIKLPEVPSDYYLKRIQGITEMDVSDMDLKDLGVLSQFKSLRKLNLDKQGIDTLTFLQGMTGLRELSLNGNELRSLAGIEGCIALEVLKVKDNHLLEIAGVKGLTKLMVLNVSGNEIEDISPVKDLIRLRTLHFEANDVEHVHFLKNLKGLRNLNFSKNKDIDNISFLTGNMVLEKLNMFNTAVADLSPLKNNPSIYHLNIGYIKVKSLDAIRHMTGLKWLNIAGNTITDFSALNRFTELRYINVNKTDIRDISGIQKMEYLKELFATHTKLSKQDIQSFKKKHPKCQITYW